MNDDTPAEPKMTMRRAYTFAAGLIYSAFLAFIIWKVGDDSVLKWIALALIAANVIREGFYMGGASLIDWAMITKAWRSGGDMRLFGARAHTEAPRDDDRPPWERT